MLRPFSLAAIASASAASALIAFVLLTGSPTNLRADDAAPKKESEPLKRPSTINPAHDPARPTPGGVHWFGPSHNRNMARTQAGKIDLCFFGDSITQTYPGDMFNKNYGKYHAANFGVGGDQIQHQLWRIENGELKGNSPKVIVLLIGTNNLGFNTAEEIVYGIHYMVNDLQGKFPKSRILLLGIFPKVEKVESQKKKREDVNEQLAKLDDKDMIRFLDISDKFFDKEKNLNGALFRDGVHLSGKGFEVWSAAMNPLLDEMMKK